MPGLPLGLGDFQLPQKEPLMNTRSPYVSAVPAPVSGTQAGPVSPSLSSQDLLLAKVTHVNMHVPCTRRAKPRNTRGNKEDPGPGPALSLAGPGVQRKEAAPWSRMW